MRDEKESHMSDRPVAVVTGASSGIGLELARICSRKGYDLIVAADEPQIADVARELDPLVAKIVAVEADLATAEGVDRLDQAVRDTGRPIDALFANAGVGSRDSFLNAPFEDIRRVIDTNVTGTLDIVHRIGRAMRDRGRGRILITGSVVGDVPGPFMAVYNASKAFLGSFAHAFRAEVEGSGVTVTCMMPGLTETRFFERAGVEDSMMADMPKDDPAMVARKGFDALMADQASVATGVNAKLQSASRVLPARMKARLFAPFFKPGR